MLYLCKMSKVITESHKYGTILKYKGWSFILPLPSNHKWIDSYKQDLINKIDKKQ